MVARYPQEIVSGETFAVRIRNSECGGFASAKIYIAGPKAANANGTLKNGSWLFSLDSSAWTAGDYQFEVWGTEADNSKRVVARERFTVNAPLSGMADGTDVRSQAQKNVDALEAYLAGVGNPDTDQSVLRYRINNRELFNYPIPELLNLLNYWRRRVAWERRKARGLPGAGPNINTYV
jgi:hypothetical protein